MAEDNPGIPGSPEGEEEECSAEGEKSQKRTKVPTRMRNKGKKGSRVFSLWRGAPWILLVSQAMNDIC